MDWCWIKTLSVETRWASIYCTLYCFLHVLFVITFIFVIWYMTTFFNKPILVDLHHPFFFFFFGVREEPSWCSFIHLSSVYSNLITLAVSTSWEWGPYVLIHRTILLIQHESILDYKLIWPTVVKHMCPSKLARVPFSTSFCLKIWDLLQATFLSISVSP